MIDTGCAESFSIISSVDGHVSFFFRKHGCIVFTVVLLVARDGAEAVAYVRVDWDLLQVK